MCKGTKIISEISNFFQGNQKFALFQAFSMLVEKMNVSNKMLGGDKKPNCKLTNLQIFHLLLIMPFCDIKGISHYANSVLSRMFSHVSQRSILGFKALTMCWSDGKPVLGLEQCLLGEEGQNEKKPQGLTVEDYGVGTSLMLPWS